MPALCLLCLISLTCEYFQLLEQYVQHPRLHAIINAYSRTHDRTGHFGRVKAYFGLNNVYLTWYDNSSFVEGRRQSRITYQ